MAVFRFVIFIVSYSAFQKMECLHDTFLVTRKEVGIKVYGEKNNYMFMSCEKIQDKFTI
jgi:hypothetical protein